MTMRTCVFVLSLIALMAAARDAAAVAIPIADPGFDIFFANTLNPVTDNTFPNQSAPGAGSGPVQDVSLLDFNTFAAKGLGDVPAGWTATGQKPTASNNTGRIRCDACFDSPSGVVASINSFGSDPYEDPSLPPGSGVFITTPGIFSQTLSGVSVQANTLYTATIEVSDLDIQGRGPFAPGEDNVVLADPTRILLILSARDSTVSPPANVLLGGTLEFSDITPGGAFTPADPNATPPTTAMQNSGGKSLLTLTVLTGSEVPAGDLVISFAAGGAIQPLFGFAPSAQTFFDNVTLDATPFTVEEDADFDGDNDVDGADFLIWQRGLGLGGQSSNANGDADGSGVVDALDLAVWKAEFGTPQAAAAIVGIPEPASAVLCIVALLGGLAVRPKCPQDPRFTIFA